MKHCTLCKTKYDDSVGFCPLDGEVLEDDPSSIVDTVLDGQYQIEAMLGKGGMGAVYRARHILLGDRVAIKVLPPEVRNNADWLRRFRREGQAARRFRHQNAVTVYDLRTAADGTIYMVMEYVEGHTLGEEIKRHGRFTPSQAFSILEPIMSVLDTAHAMGVVHRDMKPENVMIGLAGTGGQPIPKLLDLGIAKMREIADGGGSTALTLAGQVLGTPYYMSPEQWGEISRDGSSEIDGRADIYSLGLVFYEMIVGSRPYRGVTLHELRREHVSVTPPPLHEVVPDVPRDFSDAIARATAKDRGDRQGTANQFAAELRAAVGPARTSDLWARTIADAPQAATVLIDDGSRPLRTQTDLGEAKTSAGSPATVAPFRSPPPGTFKPEPPKPQPAPPASNAHPPLGGMAPAGAPNDMASSGTILQPPRAYTPEAPAKRASKGPLMFGIAATLGVVLLLAAVGGFFAYRWMTAKCGDDPTNVAVNKGKTATNGQPTEPALSDVGQYWLELHQESAGEQARVAGVVPLDSGQPFKFHFTFNADGYLYIVGPGAQNQPTGFLTAKPAAASGLASNEVRKGTDFSFPGGEINWLELDKKPGTEEYTIIFSPKQLTSPQFLQEPAGRQLTIRERGALASFVEQYRSNQATSELNDTVPTQQFVAVRVPASGGSDPISFAIRIEHK